MRARVGRAAREERQRRAGEDQGRDPKHASRGRAEPEAARSRVGRDEEQPGPVAGDADRADDEPGDRDRLPETNAAATGCHHQAEQGHRCHDQQHVEPAELERLPEPHPHPACLVPEDTAVIVDRPREGRVDEESSRRGAEHARRHPWFAPRRGRGSRNRRAAPSPRAPRRAGFPRSRRSPRRARCAGSACVLPTRAVAGGAGRARGRTATRRRRTPQSPSRGARAPRRRAPCRRQPRARARGRAPRTRPLPRRPAGPRGPGRRRARGRRPRT